MIPKTKGWKVAYFALLAISLLVVGFCVFVWLWAGTTGGAWRSAYATAIFVTAVAVPIVISPIFWSLGIFLFRFFKKREAGKSIPQRTAY